VRKLFVDGFQYETVVMARATIESVLRERMDIDSHIAKPSKLIADARTRGLLTDETAARAHQLVESANQVLHEELPTDLKAKEALQVVALVIGELSP
jgi:hypothetical protein